MLQFYPQIKHVHVILALAVGGVFAMRFLAASFSRASALRTPLRYLSWTVDVAILTAALMLLTVLPSGLFANGWLAAKLGCLLVFVAARHFSARPALRSLARGGWFVLGAVALIQAYWVARTHHPAGLFFFLG